MLLNHRQSSLSFHAELYNMIPEHHILKRVNKHVDFSFIYDLVKDSYCTYYGRPANEPEILFRLLFIQFLYGLSDERVIEDTQVNLAYKWFLGLNPEEPLPNASQLSRFRRHRLGVNKIEKVLEHIVKQCVDKGLIKSTALILDSTHTLANATKDKPLDVLKKAANRIIRSVKKQHRKLYQKLPKFPKLEGTEQEQAKQLLHYLSDLTDQVQEKLPDAEGSLKEKIDIAKQIVEDERLLTNKGISSAIDPDARFGRKSKNKSFYGYKNHIAMTEEEIITSVHVTPGNEDDGKQLKKLVNNTKEQELPIKEVLADTAYSAKENLTYLQEKVIVASIPLNPAVYGTREDNHFQYDKENDEVICPAGHSSIRKAKTGKKGQGTNQVLTFYFDTNLCHLCPLREGCYKGTKEKTYSISIKSEEHQQQMRYLTSDEYKSRKGIRNRIEHKNAELKNVHGLIRAKYRGQFGMQIQAILTAFVVNAKRMIKLEKALFSS
ncbi:IS1182 family transposase [Aneurinibacillus sp. Ricciae_BoGa-3]|uniref:IS1182 family transposase n=1 Tax=Aneurinibacillus sp. Ricciae_BoGa-3 TaxID=3022697 RepID=UPI00233FD6CD|nr:IS1182 family transposase [Aneurinibacillus sp. Ricciae_BoGa-3]WCK55919.1 IS1182 family transposase [Aneurinibacillus sp. Ricciae_BoGa-3]